MSTPISIVGNLTADPELRFTASGKAVAKLRVAVSERRKAADGTWEDGDATYWSVTVWDRLAEHVGDSLAKGQRVIAIGRVASRTWETKEGEKRVEYEITADAIGPDLKWDTVKVSKASKGGGKATPPAADDPWAHGAVGLDEVPF
jgi:single-strand DNA-binding protein